MADTFPGKGNPTDLFPQPQATVAKSRYTGNVFFEATDNEGDTIFLVFDPDIALTLGQRLVELSTPPAPPPPPAHSTSVRELPTGQTQAVCSCGWLDQVSYWIEANAIEAATTHRQAFQP